MTVVHIPTNHELQHSPERAHLAVLIAASIVAKQAVCSMNPCVDELCPVVPRTLQTARDLVEQLDALHERVKAYIVAWDEAFTSPTSSDEDCPF